MHDHPVIPNSVVVERVADITVTDAAYLIEERDWLAEALLRLGDTVLIQAGNASIPEDIRVYLDTHKARIRAARRGSDTEPVTRPAA